MAEVAIEWEHCRPKISFRRSDRFGFKPHFQHVLGIWRLDCFLLCKMGVKISIYKVGVAVNGAHKECSIDISYSFLVAKSEGEKGKDRG